MKMEQTVGSETSEIRTQTPGNYPKRNTLHLEHGESLKTRMSCKGYAIDVLCKKKSEQGKCYTKQNRRRYRWHHGWSILSLQNIYSLIPLGFPFCLHKALSTYALLYHFQGHYQAQST